MPSSERPPTDQPRELPRWAKRLRDALVCGGFVIIGTVLLATGQIPIPLSSTLQRLVNIVLIAEAVAFLSAGLIATLALMKYNPATSRLQAWGHRLLVAAVYGGAVLITFGHIIIGQSPGLHLSNAELLTVTIVGVVLFALGGLGLLFEFVALIGEARHEWRSRRRRPPADANVS